MMFHKNDVPDSYRQFEKANHQYHRRNRLRSVSFGVLISYILVTVLAIALWTDGFGMWKDEPKPTPHPIEVEGDDNHADVTGPADVTPGGDNPGGQEPGGDNPGADNPGTDNPGGETVDPGNTEGENPGGENPVQTEDFTVRFLDVGQGAAVLITTGGKSMLIDGGGPKRSSFVVSYLKNLGITKLDSIVATHYDNDHISGLVGALNVFEVAEVWGPDYETDTRTYLSFRRKLEELGLTRKTPLPGDTMQLGEAMITFLAPEPGEQSNENDYSIAMKITYRDFSLVLSGDATASSEKKILKLGIDLKCDIYYVAHHGSASSSSEPFLNAMKPRVAIISVGKDNGYGHPTEECLSRLANLGAAVYRTDEQGTICVTYGEEKIQIGFEPRKK